jgi:acetyltransferase
VVIRRVRPSDLDTLIEFYSGLSEASRYARFLGFTHGVDDQTARSFCTPDHMHQEGFVALAPGDGSRLVGHLCLEPAGERKLELAIAIADAYQGRGIGRRLMEAAIEWAQAHHVLAILASAFADNAHVLRLLDTAPYPAHVAPADSGVVDVVIPLVPELLPARPVAVPAELRASRRGRRARHRPLSVSRCSRVVWRGTRRPVPDAGG